MLGAWAALFIELLCVLFWNHRQLTGIWEAQMGGFGLAPAWLLLGAPAGALGGAVASWFWRAVERSSRALLALASGLFFALVAWGVGGGRHLASLEARGGFAAFGFSCVVVSVWWLAPLLRRRVASRTGRPAPLLLVALLVLAGVTGLINAFVLVRLYPMFHVGLSVLSLACVGAALSLWVGFRESRSSLFLPELVVLVLLGVASVLVLPASRRVRGFDHFRWIVSEHSVNLRHGVELSTKLAPPEPIETAAWSTPLGSRRPRTTSVDFRGRNVLLVTIDALRADHLGAYGAERETSPHFDALAREGVLFDAAYAATPHTSYSLTSLMTGKYMRPLLLQGAGSDSDLWPELLRTYGYKTAGFYPPAVFFIDGDRFASFRDRQFGFEYAKVEFAEGDLRIGQVEEYLDSQSAEQRLFLWVHLFGPHEPYEQKEKDFGHRDIDRYDSEVHSADATLGRIVELFRKRDPNSVVLVSADHGEEFGDHGGRYHGTHVYDEQVRVPLLIAAPGVAGGKRIQEPVQTIDLLPTLLGGLSIPIPPRIRGRDLRPLLVEEAHTEEAQVSAARALSETEDYVLLAEKQYRLICARRSGACQLFDILVDPGQKKDISREEPRVLESLRQAARELTASHGHYETQGLRAEGKGWPDAILQGLSGDVSVARELANLLDDADVHIRRKSAELLFELSTESQVSAQRLAFSREEDAETRRWLALGLTRMGHPTPWVRELLQEDTPEFRRLAALVLAEQGDRVGEQELIDWWSRDTTIEFERAKELLAALAKIRSKKAVPFLVMRLGDVRLRPYLARALEQIGDDDARPFLAKALLEERYVSARTPLARSILSLGGKTELVLPLTRFLGVPDPLEGGVALALEAGILDKIGGPNASGLKRLQQLSDSGVQVEVTVPFVRQAEGVRLLLLVRSKTGEAGTLVVGRGIPRTNPSGKPSSARALPDVSGERSLRLVVPAEAEPRDATREASQLAVTLPSDWGVRPGHRVSLDLFADRHTEVLALVVLPLREELPPPPPEPWEKAEGAGKP